MQLSHLTSISNLDIKKIKEVKIGIILNDNNVNDIVETINLTLSSSVYNMAKIFLINGNNVKKNDKERIKKIYASLSNYTHEINLDYLLSEKKVDYLKIKYKKHLIPLKEKSFKSYKSNYNINGDKIKNGNSIIVACKNRVENLQESLKSRLSIEDLNEIIIIDWSSDKEIKIPYKDHRIKLYKVKNQHKWCLTKAYNLAINLSSYTNILKLDSEDIIENKKFFSSYKLDDTSFFSGYINFSLEKNDYQFSGKLYIKRKTLFLVNGYNEYIRLYGFDDVDLKNRLINHGIKNKSLEINDFSFIHNSDESRLQGSDIEIHKILYLHAKIYKYNIPKWDISCHMSEFKKDGKSFLLEKEYTICIFTQLYLKMLSKKLCQ